MVAREYEILPTSTLELGSPFLHVNTMPEVVHLEDPAQAVLNDFSLGKPMTIGQDETIDDALTEMRICDEHLLLVIDKEQAVVGLISSGDILGAKTVKVIQERKIPRIEVKVRMVMTPQKDIISINFEDLRHAKVGNVVNTLRDKRAYYGLVIETDVNNKQVVRGMFHLSKISKALGIDVASDLIEAHSLAELQNIHS